MMEKELIDEVKTIMEGLMSKDAVEKLSIGELTSINEVSKVINESRKTKNIDGIQKFDIRNKVLWAIYCDCENMKKTAKRNEYRNDFDQQYRYSENVVHKIAFGKRWATKKGGHFDYDYDASLISSYILCKTILNKGKIFCIKGYEYKICCDDKGNNNIYFRGDVMNSWLTTLNEFLDKYNNDFFIGLPSAGRRRIESLCNLDSYREKSLPSYIIEFMEVVYTIGNFALVPYEPINFSIKRNAFIKDYWDITLRIIYNYYMEANAFKVCNFLLGDEIIENWLKKFGSGQNGWNDFVKQNFMDPFVQQLGSGEYGEPLELWDNHFNGSLLPKEDWQFEQFFVNAKLRILERGELIAKELIKQYESTQ